jgi:hypothetical protein
MLKKRLRTGYDIYNIQSEHVVYRTYSQQPINSFLPILKVMCGMNPKISPEGYSTKAKTIPSGSRVTVRFPSLQISSVKQRCSFVLHIGLQYRY